MSSNIELSYSPTDFFYVKYNNLMPTDCNTLAFDVDGKPVDINSLTWDTSCNDANFKDNSMKCVQKELCKNQEKAQTLETTNNTHKGLDKNYIDSSMQYDIAFVDVINLGIGIIFAIFIIYKNQNMV